MIRRHLPAIAAAALLYAVAAIVCTWPLGRHAGTTVLEANSLYGVSGPLIQRDIYLGMWVFAWESHALLTNPLGIFHANAFYPAPYSLALCDHSFANLLWFAPVYWVTRNPVFAHQAMILAGFVMSGLGMAAWVVYWTRDRAAAVAAGFFFAFMPYRMWQIGSPHVISIYWFPVVLLGVDLTFARARSAAGPVLLGAALILSSLCSYYVGYATFLMLAAYVLVRLAERDARQVAIVGRIAVAGLIAAAVVGVVTIPYLLQRRLGVISEYQELGTGSLALVAILKFGLTGLLAFFVTPKSGGIPQFLGWTTMLLAVVALVCRAGRPRGALLAVALSGVVVSLGPVLLIPNSAIEIPMPYALLSKIVPGFSSMRAPQRFGALTTCAVACLAGLGLAHARLWLRGRGRDRSAALLPWVAVVTLLIEVTPRRLAVFSVPSGAAIPPVYRWLAVHGDGGPLIELPARPQNLLREGRFMYYSTYHWLPLVNGYSAYPPPVTVAIMKDASDLPEPAALDRLLAQVKLRWVVLHRGDLQEPLRAPYEAGLRGRLRLVAEFGDDALYAVPAT